MADITALKNALRNAHNAGDTVAATKLANKIKSMSAGPAPEAQGSGIIQNVKDTLQDSTTGIKQGLTLGFGDELSAGLMTPIEMAAQAIRGDDVSMSGAYDTNLERERADIQTAQQRSPVANTIGNVAGGLVTAGGIAKTGLSATAGAKATLGSMMGRGAAEGAAYGAVSGFGTGEGMEDRFDRAFAGGAAGAVTGGALGAVGRGIAGHAAKGKTAKVIKTLTAKKNDLYAQVKQSGFTYSGKQTNQLLDRMEKKLMAEGISKSLHKKAWKTMVQIRKDYQGKRISLDQLDKLRQSIGDDVTALSTVKGKAKVGRLGSIMEHEIKDFINVSAIPPALKKTLLDAQATNTQLSKLTRLSDATNKAKRNAASSGSGGNIDNTIRTQVQRIIETPSLARGFSPAEIQKLEAIVKGGNVQQIFREIGKLSPQGSGLTKLFALFAGATHPVIGGGLAAGAGSKVIADNMTKSAVQKMMSEIARTQGGASAPALSVTQRALLEAAARQGHKVLPMNDRQPSGMNR